MMYFKGVSMVFLFLLNGVFFEMFVSTLFSDEFIAAWGYYAI